MVLALLACGWQTWQRKDAANALPRALALGLMMGVLAYLMTGLKEPSSFDSGQLRALFLLGGLLVAAERASRPSTRRTEK